MTSDHQEKTLKMRRCKSAAPGLLTRRSRTESHWDPWDPVLLARHQLDGVKHWSQLKAETYANQRPKTAAAFAAAPRVQRSPHPNSPSWLAKLNTSYNQRARQGFVYWFTARPKPTLYGRYSLGAKHMQYGLGMAPRS